MLTDAMPALLTKSSFMHAVATKPQQEERHTRLGLDLLDLLEMGEASSSLGCAILSVSVSPPELVLEAAKHRHIDCTDRAARSV